jgi:membrane-bound lytic murein transglycosylase MltF
MKLKRTSLYFGLLLAVLAAMVALRIIATRDDAPPVRDLDEIRAEGVLRVGVEYNRNSYYVSGDTLAGTDYALALRVGKRSGLRIEIYPEASLSALLEALHAGRIDVVARPMPITTSRMDSLAFTAPLQTQKLILVQRAARYNDDTPPLRNQLDLAQCEVHIPAGSPARDRLANLSREIADSIYVVEDPLYGEEQLIMLVARGEIDYAICSERSARALAPSYPELDLQTDVSFNQFQGWALRKSSPVLLDSINAWISEN